MTPTTTTTAAPMEATTMTTKMTVTNASKNDHNKKDPKTGCLQVKDGSLVTLKRDTSEGETWPTT